MLCCGYLIHVMSCISHVYIYIYRKNIRNWMVVKILTNLSELSMLGPVCLVFSRTVFCS